MRHIVLSLSLLLLLSSFLSCRHKIYVPVVQHHSERIIERDTLVSIVNSGEVLHQFTIDTVSLLQGKYAVSEASITQGVLSHSLIVYPRQDSIVMSVREVYITDSIPYPVPAPERVVAVTPSWAWWLLALDVIVAIIAVVRRSRRPIGG